MSKLLPCPYCGGEYMQSVNAIWHKDNCWLRSIPLHYLQSIKDEEWNTRPKHIRTDNSAVIESLQKELQHYKDEFVDVYNQCAVMQERIKDYQDACRQKQEIIDSHADERKWYCNQIDALQNRSNRNE